MIEERAEYQLIDSFAAGTSGDLENMRKCVEEQLIELMSDAFNDDLGIARSSFESV